MLATVLPLALVVGLSPLPILPAVMLLMTARARANGLAFLGAWLGALTILVSASALLGGASDPEPVSDEGVGWIQVSTGAVFLVAALVKWVRRPRPGATKESPAWVAALDGYTSGQSARLGALLACGNPKNVVIALAAGAEIAVLAAGPGAITTGIVGFVIIGSIGVATPILGYAVLGERAVPALVRIRAWLDANSTALGVSILLVLGVLLLLKGIPVVA